MEKRAEFQGRAAIENDEAQSQGEFCIQPVPRELVPRHHPCPPDLDFLPCFIPFSSRRKRKGSREKAEMGFPLTQVGEGPHSAKGKGDQRREELHPVQPAHSNCSCSVFSCSYPSFPTPPPLLTMGHSTLVVLHVFTTEEPSRFCPPWDG